MNSCVFEAFALVKTLSDGFPPLLPLLLPSLLLCNWVHQILPIIFYSFSPSWPNSSHKHLHVPILNIQKNNPLLMSMTKRL